jgi:hypothetical protein
MPEIHHEFQEGVREAGSDKVSEMPSRHVATMLTANHIDPDLASEVNVLDRPSNRNHERLEAANRDRATAARQAIRSTA